MKYITFPLLSIIFLLSVSCNKKNNNPTDIFHINLQKKNSVSINDLIKDIEIISLETTDLSIIRDITKIEFYQNIIYIFDLSQNNIFIFNREGDYINKIDNKGQGPNEYLNISDFTIAKCTNNICILDAIKNSLLYYDLQGNFLYTENLPKLKESTYNIFQFLNSTQVMFWTSDENNRLKIYDKDSKSIISEKLPRKGYPRLAFFCSDSLLLTEMSNSILSCNSKEISEYYRIEIENLKPELREDHSIPKSFDTKSQLTFIDKLIKSENIDYLIKDFFDTPKYILLSFYRKSHYYTFLIEKKTSSYFNFNIIDVDFIPFIKFANDNILLGVYYPELISIYKLILNDAKFEILENHSEGDNPLLIQYNLK